MCSGQKSQRRASRASAGTEMVKRIASRAWIQRLSDNALTTVTILRRSPRGATILARNVALPREFILLLAPDGSLSRRCRIVRQDRYMAVVEFINAL